MQVLVALARERGEIVSRDDLIASCWAGRIVGEDAINRCTFRLRRLAQGVGGFELETIPRVGYRLTETGAASSRFPAGRVAAIAAAVAVVLLIAAGAAWWAVGRSVVVEAPHAPRVAVAGFQPLNGDAAARTFAAGLGDEATGVLGEHALAVGRPNAEADMVLTGSVVRDGSNWRVRADLDDTRSGFVLWSQDFEGAVGLEDGLRDEVTAAVTDAVLDAMDPLRQPGLKLKPRTVALYIRANKMMAEPDPKNGDQAELMLSEVIARAPDFAAARQALAEQLTEDYRSANEPERAALRERATREANAAIRADPRAGGDAYDAFYQLARIDHSTALWQAEDGLLKGIALAPDSFWIQMRECRLLLEVGRGREALHYCERARALRPLSPPIDWPYAQALDAAGRQDQALQAVEETARFHPNHVGSRVQRFEMAAFRGSPERALALLPDLVRPPEVVDAQGAAGLARFLAARRSGAPADIDAAIAALWRIARQSRSPGWLVFGAAALGRPDEAFKGMDDIGVVPDRALVGLFTGVLLDPSAAPLRSDPRFWRAAARAGYLDYWRKRGVWPDFCYDPKLPFDCRRAAVAATG